MVRTRNTDLAMLADDGELFRLFGEQARLVGSCCGCRGLAARNSYDSEHGDFRESATRYKDAIGCGIQVRWRNL